MGAAEAILIVDDDVEVSTMLETRLSREGFTVYKAADGKQGLDQARNLKPSLILLDLTMPVMGGLEVCKALRQEQKTKSIPIIMVTAHAEEEDVTRGLEIGADDYVAKPFSTGQLIARIRAVLRRSLNGSAPSPEAPTAPIVLGPLTIDLRSHEATLRGNVLPLTLAEFTLLATMAAEPGKAFTREALAEKISRHEGPSENRNIDVHIMSVRKKLGADSGLIQTVRGIGYRSARA